VIKDNNLKRHYNTKHTSKYNDLGRQFWSDKLEQLKSQLSDQQSLFFKGTMQTGKQCELSYWEKKAKCGKPYREFI
jgi:hypothetical protein